jgi:hypothetical protein
MNQPNLSLSTFTYDQQEQFLCWFKDPCYDLYDLADSFIQEQYLARIQEVVYRTGATNFAMAEYILGLEMRLETIESKIGGKV